MQKDIADDGKYKICSTARKCNNKFFFVAYTGSVGMNVNSKWENGNSFYAGAEKIEKKYV